MKKYLLIPIMLVCSSSTFAADVYFNQHEADAAKSNMQEKLRQAWLDTTGSAQEIDLLKPVTAILDDALPSKSIASKSNSGPDAPITTRVKGITSSFRPQRNEWLEVKLEAWDDQSGPSFGCVDYQHRDGNYLIFLCSDFNRIQKSDGILFRARGWPITLKRGNYDLISTYLCDRAGYCREESVSDFQPGTVLENTTFYVDSPKDYQDTEAPIARDGEVLQDANLAIRQSAARIRLTLTDDRTEPWSVYICYSSQDAIWGNCQNFYNGSKGNGMQVFDLPIPVDNLEQEGRLGTWQIDFLQVCDDYRCSQYSDADLDAVFPGGRSFEVVYE